MNDCFSLDMEELQSWIGRTEIAHDIVAPRLVRELGATLDNDRPEQEPGAPAQLAIHWCLAPPAPGTSALGADGHPARGGFLPPVPLPRRMWAGGHLQLKDRLLVGDAIERCSRIADVTLKQGRSGILCFVVVDHVIATARGPAILERQDIVYRGPQSDSPAADPAPLPRPQWTRDGKADPVMLFRYSALTFNCHRIHYDRPYATEVEGYPGLVCHGPLQATLLLDFAFAIKGSAPASFKFRSVKPLFEGVPFQLCACEADAGLHLWIQTADGVATMDAEAHG
jgi:3-methylfumaryl-CoA hydratase